MRLTLVFKQGWCWTWAGAAAAAGEGAVANSDDDAVSKAEVLRLLLSNAHH